MTAADSRVIVITVDASEHSVRAFDWYVKNLMRPETDTVYCVHVAETISLPIMTVTEPLSIPADDWVQKINGRRKKVEELSNNYEYKLTQYKLKGGFIAEDPKDVPVGQQICDIAQSKKADMVVMGNRGLGTLRRTFLGSVSDYVVHHSGVAVMIIPPTTT